MNTFQRQSRSVAAQQWFRRRWSHVAVLVAAASLALPALLWLTPTSGRTAVLNPSDDADTSQGSPSATHGSDTTLNVNSGSGTERRVFAKFTVASIPAGATNVTASLQLYSRQSASAGVFTLKRVASTWNERSLAWNNQPAPGTAIASRTGLRSGYLSWDVSGYVTGNGTYAVVLTSSSKTQRYFTSKEGSANQRPQLVLTWTDPTGGGTAPSAVTRPASGITDSTATLNGTVNPGGLATTCHFDWGTTTGYGSTTPNDTGPGSGSSAVSVSTPLSGLVAATTYHYRLVCSNSAGTSLGADATFNTAAAAGGNCTGLCLTVSGNHLVNSTGATVQLHGVNRSGTHYACSEGYGIFDGPSDDASLDAMLTWHVNAVRVSLNDACWLGVNGVPAAYGGTNYQNAIADYVARISAKGMYAILDLHLANPGTTLQPDQVPMADRDHANTFWASVAARFKNNPAVAFDLFNEPYPDSNHNTPAAWTCVRDGGTCPGVNYTAAGSQEMLNAIRGTGATNVVLVGGPEYAGTLDKWTAYKPTDPANQLAASIHIYYGTPASPEWSPCYQQSCWDSIMAPLAATTPIVIGELGEHDCSYALIGGTSSSLQQQDLLTWADTHGISYLPWAWFTGNCAAEPALISSYTGTPTAYGQGVKNHFLQQSSAR